MYPSTLDLVPLSANVRVRKMVFYLNILQWMCVCEVDACVPLVRHARDVTFLVTKRVSVLKIGFIFSCYCSQIRRDA